MFKQLVSKIYNIYKLLPTVNIMDNSDQIPKRRPKNTGWGRFLPFLIIGYILFTTFLGSIRIPTVYSPDPVSSVLFNSSIFIGGIVVAVILLINYYLFKKNT